MLALKTKARFDLHRIVNKPATFEPSYPPFYAGITRILVRKIDLRRCVRYTISRHVLALLLLVAFGRDPPRHILAVGTKFRDVFRSPLLAAHGPLFFCGVRTRSPATKMYYPHILADFGVRSSVGFAPPYIVLHGSTGFCLLTASAKFWSKWPPPLPPLGQTRDENQGEILLPSTCWPELPAASRRGPSTGSVAQ